MLLDEAVSLFKTKTFWGGAISMLGKALALAGYDLAPADAQLLAAGIPMVISFMGDLWAIYGRLKAEKKAVVKTPSAPAVSPPAAVIGFLLLLPLMASLGACQTAGSVSPSRQAFAAACVALVGTDDQSGAVAAATKLEAAGELKASIADDLNTAFHALVPICTDPTYAAAASDATLSEKASEINATVATVQANGG